MRRALLQRARLALVALGGAMQRHHQLRGLGVAAPAALPLPLSAAAAARAARLLGRRLCDPPPTLLAARAISSSSSSRSNNAADDNNADDLGLRPDSKLRLSPPAPNPLTFRKWSVARRARRADPLSHDPAVRAARRTRGEVEVVLELPPASSSPAGGLLGGASGGNAHPSTAFPRAKAERLAQQLSEDAPAVVELAVRERAALAASRGERYVPPQVALASVVLCDDARMRELNLEHRGKDCPTDVLTLELRDREVDRGRMRLPVRLLGDAIISLDTAARQARERRELEAARSRSRQEGLHERVGGGKRRRRAATTAADKGFSPAAKATASKSGDDGYTLLDELRVLLVHGALHLVGMDHEAGEREHEEMAAAERRLMAALGWRGSGLISAAEAEAAAAETEEWDENDDNKGTGGGGGGAAAAAAAAAGAGAAAKATRTKAAVFSTRPRLVALDMDGTLLNAQSRIDPASARVIRAAAEEKGVRVVLATGKARPAALAAARAAALEPLLCSSSGPGVFLQGLAVHGAQGESLSDRSLPPSLVRAALLWSQEHGVPLCCFLGDECAALGGGVGNGGGGGSLSLAPELVVLHERYYEPLSVPYGSADALLERAAEVGGTRKLLFMTEAARVSGVVEPLWRRELGSSASASAAAGASSASSSSSSSSPFTGLADVTIAVPEMLEVVPRGVNKMVGLRTLLSSLGIPVGEAMAVGDGLNDLEMIRGVSAGGGIGVAMGNAVGEVKEAAGAVVAGHDAGGIVEAFERFVL